VRRVELASSPLAAVRLPELPSGGRRRPRGRGADAGRGGQRREPGVGGGGGQDAAGRARTDFDRELIGQGAAKRRGRGCWAGLPGHRCDRAQLHQRGPRAPPGGPRPSSTASGSWCSRSCWAGLLERIPMAVLAAPAGGGRASSSSRPAHLRAAPVPRRAAGLPGDRGGPVVGVRGCWRGSSSGWGASVAADGAAAACGPGCGSSAATPHGHPLDGRGRGDAQLPVGPPAVTAAGRDPRPGAWWRCTCWSTSWTTRWSTT